MKEEIIIVDENDQQINTAEKLKAHEQGKLHRAFSILIFNSKGELLIQKRAKSKYHSAGLWSNTCCSHPRAGETLETATHRRLQEEMGFDCELKEQFSFIYKVGFENGLTEHEFSHVFSGNFDGQPVPSPEEAENIKWVNLDELKEDIKAQPDKYAYWFKIIVKKL